MDVLDAPNSSGAVNSNGEIQNCLAATSRPILLGTAVVGNYHRGETFRATALIDSGSQARVSSLDGACAGAAQSQCSFSLTSLSRVEAVGLVPPKLTGMLPNLMIDVSKSPAFSGISLADPKFNKGGHIDILIGGDAYPDILLEGIRKNILGKLIAQESIFGWILSGSLPELKSKKRSTFE